MVCPQRQLESSNGSRRHSVLGSSNKLVSQLIVAVADTKKLYYTRIKCVVHCETQHSECACLATDKPRMAEDPGTPNAVLLALHALSNCPNEFDLKLPLSQRVLS